jgi:hypothetical protein
VRAEAGVSALTTIEVQVDANPVADHLAAVRADDVGTRVARHVDDAPGIARVRSVDAEHIGPGLRSSVHRRAGVIRSRVRIGWHATRGESDQDARTEKHDSHRHMMRTSAERRKAFKMPNCNQQIAVRA